MGAKIRKMIDHASELLELVVNVIIIIAVVVAILYGNRFWHLYRTGNRHMHFWISWGMY